MNHLRSMILLLGIILNTAASAEIKLVVVAAPLSGQIITLQRLGFQLHARVGDHLIGTLPEEAVRSLPVGVTPLSPAADFSHLFIVSPRSLALHSELQAGLSILWESSDGVLIEADEVVLNALSSAKIHFRALSPQPLPLQEPSTGGFGLDVINPFVGVILDEVSSADYQSYLQSLQGFVTRNTYNPQCDSAATWIRQQFQSFGLTAYLDTFQIGTYTKYNVIAEQVGTAFPHQMYYIAAHYDATAGLPIFPEPNAPGADDDGSGAALVLECARVLSQFDCQKTIRFAVFAGNEQGLIGSEAYVPELLQTPAQVLGVFDADMVAYSGLDPWPPDVVIYSNNNPASISLMNKMNEAITTYTGTLLQPVLLTDPTMIYSDHAPFWDANLPAILAMEDEAWGDDLNPRYHSPNDSLQYLNIPYAVNVLKAMLAATADLAIPLGSASPILTAANALINDSQGNNNGQIEYGEFIYLAIPVVNAGNSNAASVNVTVSESDPYITFLDWQQNYGTIPGQDTITVANAFSAEVSDTVPDEHLFDVTVSMTSGSNTWQSVIQMVAHAPEIHILSVVVNDTTTGNGNGQLEVGETADLDITLGNSGSYEASNLIATLSVQDPYFSFQGASASYGNLASGASATRSYRVTVLQNAPAYFLADFTLSYSVAGGWMDAGFFSLNVGDLTQMPTGPDNYGYLAYENLDEPLGPTFNWIEIDPHQGGAGTELNFTQDDQTLYVDLPFTFRYYGLDYTEISICSNGWIVCGHTTSTDHTNSPIPNNDGPPAMIAPFWDDLSPQQDGTVSWYYNSAQHYLIVEFNDVRDYYPTSAHETFEVILYDPAYYPTMTGDGEILIQYGALDDVASCTIGLENNTQQIGLQLLYNTYLSPTCTALDSGKAILFTTGTNLPDVIITLTPFGLPIQIPASGGSFNFNVAVANNDTLPVSFDGWCNLTLPNGSLYGPVLGPVALTLNPGISINRNRTQNVPGSAPSGIYFYNGYTGDYPGEVWNDDSFSFVKLTTGGGPGVDNWANWGEPFEGETTTTQAALPSEFKINQNYPNPFNAETVITLELPEISRVNLELFNVQGQNVGRIFAGVEPAGWPKIRYTASQLPSGIYFYRVTTEGLEHGGKFMAVRKMLLLK